MDKLNNLVLVKKEMDTTLAQEFIKNNKEPQWPDKGFANVTQPDNVKFVVKSELLELNKLARFNMSMELAKKIEDNAELFAQLLYLANGTESRDVKDGYIKLMSQYLKCSNALWNAESYSHFILYVNESTHLFHLALIAYAFHTDAGIYPFICVEQECMNMKHVCRLFVNLCHDVGFYIPLYFGAADIKINHLYYRYPIQPDKNVKEGCTGVITEGSDLDSAVDAFIQSSKTAPWRLEQIYIQESIFEDFRNALATRAAQPAESSEIVAGNKTFLFECLNPASGVPVHAYRTAKELLSLLATPYLSLWAVDSALSNELTLKSSATTVWINDYASFDGPPRASLSIFEAYCYVGKPESISLDHETKLKLWSKMQTLQRLQVIISVAQKSEMKCARDLLPELTHKWRSDDFIHVTDSSICFGIQHPMGVITCWVVNGDNFLSVVKALVNGNAVVADANNSPFFEALFQSGVPFFDSYRYYDTPSPLTMEKLKVVRTNHGTIFAN